MIFDNLITQINVTTLIIIFFVMFIFSFLFLKSKKIGTTDHEIQQWSKYNSIKLYKHLRVQGWLLECMIVSLGCYTAIKSDNGLTMAMIYMLVVAISEIVKLHITESLFRFPRISLIVIALPALVISIFFTSETLIRITGDITKESNLGIPELYDDIKDNEATIATTEKQIKTRKDNISNFKNYISDSQLLESNKELAKNLQDEIISLKNIRDTVISKNNFLEKNAIENNIKNLKTSFQSIDNAINEHKRFYQADIASLRNAKFQEVNEAGPFSKNAIRERYDISIKELETRHYSKLSDFEKEKKYIGSEIKKYNYELQLLAPLSKPVKEQLILIDAEIAQLKVNLNGLRSVDNDLVQKYTFQIENELKAIEQDKNNIHRLRESNNGIYQEISELKTGNFFYNLASIWFQKEASNINEDQIKSFIKVFIGLSAIGLSLMPVFLFAISVLIEKSLKSESDRITYREYLLKVLYLLKETCSHFVQTTNTLLKVAKEKRKDRIEESFRVKELKSQKASKEREYEHLKNASSHELVLKQQDDFEKSTKRWIANNFENFDKSILEKIMPEIKKSIESQIETKEINAQKVQNYFSKEYITKILDGDNKKK